VTRVPAVITGELKSKIDRVWDSFWSGGLSNPLEVIEQITGVVEDPVFLPGQAHLRWSRFKNDDPEVLYKLVGSEVFPFLQKLGEQVGGDGSTYSEDMKARRPPDGAARHQRRPL
jgi:type I restriction enzyme M protein